MPDLASMIRDALQEYEKNIQPVLERNIYNVSPRLDELIGKLENIKNAAGPCLLQRRIEFLRSHLIDLKLELDAKGERTDKFNEFVRMKLSLISEKTQDIRELQRQDQPKVGRIAVYA